MSSHSPISETFRLMTHEDFRQDIITQAMLDDRPCWMIAMPLTVILNEVQDLASL
jgi:hypothetical protein